MEMLQVTVTIQERIWDQFIVYKDHIIFTEFNNSRASLEDIRTTKAFIPSELALGKSKIKFTLGNHEQDLLDKTHKLGISSHIEGPQNVGKKEVLGQHNIVPKLYVNGYLLSLFVRTLQLSPFYRKLIFARFRTLLNRKKSLEININLVEPHKHIIDFAWNERMERLALERRELDTAMSWFSTLGGAFSALGEEFLHCAEIAGRISVQQFSLALRLGDPLTVARCKLYLALSLVQRGLLKSARRIIQQQYCLAKAAPVVDTRLVSMCLGIWAKLKYEYNKKRSRKMHTIHK